MNETRQLLAVLERAYNRRSWHGTNLRGAIRNVTVRQAAWRPEPSRHNIWELVVHAAYWKYIARRRLASDPRGSFPLKGSNWFERPVEPTVQAWRADVALLDAMHRQLLEAVLAVPPATLHRKRTGSKDTRFELIAGVAAHDLYHAGQIQLLKTLAAAVL